MTTKTIHEQCKERLQQRASRRAQKKQRAADVVAHVLRTELIHASDVKVTALFTDRVGHLDNFIVQVHVARDVGVEGVTPYRVRPAVGPNTQRIELNTGVDCYDDAPAQEWRSLRTATRFDNIVDAILDATEWTLGDLS